MSEMTAPNKFRRRTKILVGLLLAVLIIGGLAYDAEVYTKLVAVLTLPVAVAFPLVYMTLPWKESILGRALMTKARAVAVLYVVSMLGWVWEFPFRGYVMGLVTTYLAVGIGFQFIVLLRIKYQAAHATHRRESMA